MHSIAYMVLTSSMKHNAKVLNIVYNINLSAIIRKQQLTPTPLSLIPATYGKKTQTGPGTYEKKNLKTINMN